MPAVRATRSVAARLNSLLPSTPAGRSPIVPDPMEEELEEVSLLEEGGGGGDQGGSAEW